MIKINSKKIFITIIFALIIIVSFLIIDTKINIIGKSTAPLPVLGETSISEQTDLDGLIQPYCKIKIIDPVITKEKNYVNLSLYYDQNMDTNIDPIIGQLQTKDNRIKSDLSDINYFEGTYFLEKSEWLNSQTFNTRLVIKKKNVEAEEVYFVISKALSSEGVEQKEVYSIDHHIYFTMDNKEPEIKKITIILDENKNKTKIVLSFHEEIDQYINNSLLINKKKAASYINNIDPTEIIIEINTIILEEILNSSIFIPDLVIMDKYLNTVNEQEIQLNKDERIEIIGNNGEIFHPEDIFIQSFGLLIGSNRAAITFNKNVYSNIQENLTPLNFELYINDKLIPNGIKEVSHIVKSNFVVLLFNDLLFDSEKYEIKVKDIYDESGELINYDQKIIGFDNSYQKYIPLIKGWNLISVNKLDENWDLFSNLDRAQEIQIYVFNTRKNKWENVESIRNIDTTAFFIKSPVPQKLFLGAENETEKFNIDSVSPGWNLIGFSSFYDEKKPFSLYNIKAILNNFDRLKATENYNYKEINKNFNFENSIAPLEYFLDFVSPYEGYWVYIDENE